MPGQGRRWRRVEPSTALVVAWVPQWSIRHERPPAACVKKLKLYGA